MILEAGESTVKIVSRLWGEECRVQNSECRLDLVIEGLITHKSAL